MSRTKKNENEIIAMPPAIDGVVQEYVGIGIKSESSARVETTGPETKNGTIVNALFVKVRREANLEADVLEILRKGDKVIIHGRKGEFYKVSTNVNKFAYISSEFIKED